MRWRPSGRGPRTAQAGERARGRDLISARAAATAAGRSPPKRFAMPKSNSSCVAKPPGPVGRQAEGGARAPRRGAAAERRRTAPVHGPRPGILPRPRCGGWRRQSGSPTPSTRRWFRASSPGVVLEELALEPAWYMAADGGASVSATSPVYPQAIRSRRNEPATWVKSRWRPCGS